MSEAPTKKRDYLDPLKEAQAVAALRASIAGLDADDELLADTIEGETSLFEVVDKLLDRMRDCDVTIEGIEAVAAGLAERKRRAEEAKKRDRAMLEQAMTIAGVEKIARPTATLSLSQRAPSVLITEESDIPARFWIAGDPKLDKKALAEAVRAHVEEPGEHEPIPGATLSNGAPSITIRTK